MKKCPFCAEEIQEEAIKCRFCGEFLEEAGTPGRKGKWYYSNSAIIIGILVAGPLVLPLVWKNPKYTATIKIVITIAVIAFTVWLCYLVGGMYKQLIQQVDALG